MNIQEMQNITLNTTSLRRISWQLSIYSSLFKHWFQFYYLSSSLWISPAHYHNSTISKTKLFIVNSVSIKPLIFVISQTKSTDSRLYFIIQNTLKYIHYLEHKLFTIYCLEHKIFNLHFLKLTNWNPHYLLHNKNQFHCLEHKHLIWIQKLHLFYYIEQRNLHYIYHHRYLFIFIVSTKNLQTNNCNLQCLDHNLSFNLHLHKES